MCQSIYTLLKVSHLVLQYQNVQNITALHYRSRKQNDVDDFRETGGLTERRNTAVTMSEDEEAFSLDPSAQITTRS